MKLSSVFLLVLLFLCRSVSAQQVPDFNFDPKIPNPLYRNHDSPVVVVDEAHHNFHTIKARYNAFAKVLTRDSYRVKPGTQPFSAASLTGVKILVIATALHASNETQWSKSTPSAFTQDEIEVVNKWFTFNDKKWLMQSNTSLSWNWQKIKSDLYLQPRQFH